ncbi:hypothetical protein C8R43DRAFT_950891 [Mycena crocata]|nr:hypothetical protein C8R43DRAFT_950891 [Mycena crocata]
MRQLLPSERLCVGLCGLFPASFRSSFRSAHIPTGQQMLCQPGSTAGEQMISPDIYWINLLPQARRGATHAIQSAAYTEVTLFFKPHRAEQELSRRYFRRYMSRINNPQGSGPDASFSPMNLQSNTVLKVVCRFVFGPQSVMHGRSYPLWSLETTPATLPSIPPPSQHSPHPFFPSKMHKHDVLQFRKPPGTAITLCIPFPRPAWNSRLSLQEKSRRQAHTTYKCNSSSLPSPSNLELCVHITEAPRSGANVDYTVSCLPATGLNSPPFFARKSRRQAHTAYECNSSLLPPLIKTAFYFRTLEAPRSGADINYTIYRPATGLNFPARPNPTPGPHYHPPRLPGIRRAAAPRLKQAPPSNFGSGTSRELGRESVSSASIFKYFVCGASLLSLDETSAAPAIKIRFLDVRELGSGTAQRCSNFTSADPKFDFSHSRDRHRNPGETWIFFSSRRRVYNHYSYLTGQSFPPQAHFHAKTRQSRFFSKNPRHGRSPTYLLAKDRSSNSGCNIKFNPWFKHAESY